MNRRLKIVTTLILTLSCSQAAIAQSKCLAREDVSAMSTVALHLALKTFIAQCKIVPASTISSLQPGLETKFEKYLARDVPIAVRALLPLIASDKDSKAFAIIAKSPDAALVLAEAGIQEAMSKDLTPENCLKAEPLVIKVASLADQDIIDIGALILELAMAKKKIGSTPITFCSSK
jgi:hypothetical protein